MYFSDFFIRMLVFSCLIFLLKPKEVIIGKDYH